MTNHSFRPARSSRTTDAFTRSVVSALDAGTERLPYRITHRLQLASQAALAAQTAVFETVEANVFATVHVGSGERGGHDQPSLPWRLLVTLLPLAAIIAGFVAIADIGDALEADETAEIDEAVLTDEVPISAYADHGFGVFLKNNRP
jgi:hypothetical protein